MYQKIHRRLAFFFAGIASLILVIMSGIYQYMSETETKYNSFLTFTGEMNTLLSNLENQTTVTYEWLTKVSAGGKYIIGLYDNEIPLSYTTTALNDSEQMLVQEVLENNKDFINSIASSAYYGSVHKEFAYKAADKQEYYICYSSMNRASGTLCTVLLFPTKALKIQFIRQRTTLLCLNLLGILALFVFSYYYTGRLLRPVREAHEKQAAFIAGASHELRTPVSVILSSISALKCADPSEQPRFFATIESEGARMSHLINELLTLVRSDNQSWLFHMEDTEPDTLLLNVYEAYKPIADGQNIRLSIQLPDEAFPVCHWDAERIAQVLEILLSNAISYSRENGSIILNLSYEHQEFRLQVIDNGIGISPAAKEHVFDRFYREDTARSGKEHFGLGLSIAKEIVSAHHGKILVDDTPGGGATFTVVLPQRL